mmetsp:Transcript_32111/g.102310  ORF Transcript_32111/g.102310 Transcript_32111/m.102310 type:complete len:137 (+) Transcript_32111:662-1072(+)
MRSQMRCGCVGGHAPIACLSSPLAAPCRVQVIHQHLQKPISFGKVDGKSCGHASNGPTMKSILTKAGLLPDILDVMAPIWSFMEATNDRAGPAVHAAGRSAKGPGKGSRGRSGSKELHGQRMKTRMYKRAPIGARH